MSLHWILAAEISRMWPDWRFAGASVVDVPSGRTLRLTDPHVGGELPLSYTGRVVPDASDDATVKALFAKCLPEGGYDFSPEDVDAFGPWRVWPDRNDLTLSGKPVCVRGQDLALLLLRTVYLELQKHTRLANGQRSH